MAAPCFDAFAGYANGCAKAMRLQSGPPLADTWPPSSAA